MTIYFPDVSSFQAGASFAGLLAAIVKATEGTDYTNPDFENARTRAAEANAFLVAYHFLHQGNAAAQAAHAHSVAGGIPLMLDVESTTGSNPTVTDVVDFVNAYRALGGIVWLVYLPNWYWSSVLGKPSLAPLASLGLLLWSSDYVSYSDKGAGWNGYGGMSPAVWQYTSGGTLNGVTGVDWNAYKGTAAQFASQATTGNLGGADPLLALGTTGAPVKVLQTRLNVWGAAPQLTVDGNFGQNTYAAVKSFQAAHRVTVDGVVGPLTWAALNAAPPAPAPKPGPQPYPAPSGLTLGKISLGLTWDAVVVNGKPVASYTVQAVGLDGVVFVHETPATNSVVLAGLNPGWTYNILVWANGGPSMPPHATIKVTV